MIGLYQYICEGGASGHMKHPYDYTDFTLRELKGLVRNLFSGKIEDITEKVDGMNIQASRNEQGEVVFIRNKSDLNSARGGMVLSDMIAKWSDKPHVLETFTKAAETIIKVFEKVPVKFFNPKPGVRCYVNAECVIAGKTNIMPYVANQVDFHDIWVYEFDEKKAEWLNTSVTRDGLDKIEKACENSDAMLTPQIIIDTVEQSKSLMIGYIKELDKIWKSVNLGERNTVEEWKKARFEEYCRGDAEWILDSLEGMDLLFERWFNANKTTNIKVIKGMYPNSLDALEAMDKKDYKKMVAACMEPLDDLFIRLGNDVIKLCKGIINDGQECQVVKQLVQDMKDVVADVRSNGSVESNGKLSQQLDRLNKIGIENINAVEGIVFVYKGKRMKLTGAFAPLNQILGAIKFSR